MSYASITAFQKYSFSEKYINEARKSIGRLQVQHTTVGAYTETEDVRAEENRRLRLFEADHASACGVRLSPLPNLHSLAEDIDTHVQMTLSRVIDKMVVDEGRALQPCRYRLFTHMSCIILYPYST